MRGTKIYRLPLYNLPPVNLVKIYGFAPFNLQEAYIQKYDRNDSFTYNYRTNGISFDI